MLDGIAAAQAAGFERIKVNAVLIRGVNDCDAVPLARYARENGLELRFIEYMPIGAEPWERDKVFLAHEFLEVVEQQVGQLVPAEDYDPRAPAMDFRYADYFAAKPSTGYETLIYDCMIGDATLFQSADNIEMGWRVVQPILDAWRGRRAETVAFYPAGSVGPIEADVFIERDGRRWRGLDGADGERS